MSLKQTNLTNEQVKNYSFLKEMYEDDYYPNNLVDKCKDILLNLCLQIEQKQPKNVDELYVLTHAVTDKFNDIQDEFYKNDSEIETVARECIGTDFEFIATAYGFKDANMEKLIATRDW